MNPKQLFAKLLEYSFYLIFFLTPFILTTVNFELFEFPKMLFVYAVTAVITGSWLGLSLVKGQLTIRRTWLLWPLLLFVASQIISTFLSIEPSTSIWGYYSRFHGGLLSTFCYTLLFLIFTSTANKRQVKNSLLALLSAAVFISLYAVAEHFGIDAKYWIQDVQSRVFSTLGQPNWLAAWLGALAPLTWYFVLRPPRSFWPTALLLAQAALLVAYGLTASLLQTTLPITTGGVLLFSIFFAAGLYGAYCSAQKYSRQLAGLKPIALLELAALLVATILFTKSRSGILALGVSYTFFWLLIFLVSGFSKKIIKKFLLLTSCFLLFFFLVGTEWTPNLWQITQRGKQEPITTKPKAQTTSTLDPQVEFFISKSTDIRKAVWEGGLKVWQHYPLFGSGVETFAYSYYNHRVRAHNDTSEWDFLYNKAHNEYLNFLATTGLVGTTAVFGLIISYFAFGLTKLIKKKPWIAGILFAPFLLLGLPQIADKLIMYPPILTPLGIGLGLAFLEVWGITTLTRAKLPQLTGLQVAFLAGFVSMIVTNFYGFSVVPVALLFFLYPAFSVILYGQKSFWRFGSRTSDSKRLHSRHWIGLTVLLLVTCYLLLVIYQYWRADKIYNYGKNLTNSGSILAGMQQLSQAIKLRPYEAGYHMELADAAATAAYAYASQEATGSAQTADQFTALADEETKIALTLNPVHLNLYKTAAKNYIVLAQIKPDTYLPQAIKTLETAERLSPTDPKITLNLALLYNQIGQAEQAQTYLEKTVELKPDYRQGWIRLAEFYEAQKEFDKAKAAYRYILDHIYSQDAGALAALKKLEE